MASRRSASARRKSAANERGAPSAAKGAPPGALGPSPLRLATGVTLALAASPLLPRLHATPRLLLAVEGAAVVLALLQLALRGRLARSPRTILTRVQASPVHYVQASMQGCVYAYWGWYWPEVYAHVPLIAAQLLFAYGLDMLVAWHRRDEWTLGFGPFPIIFSTNLFMWFRDDWFALQFAMVATGVLGKELVKWERDGRRTHVFNPSALSLFLFSLGLIATGTTHVTWGQDIAATLGLPPNIYLEVFLVGLVVQLLFSVTLVTLAATVALCAMNLGYTAATGTYHFLMTNVPIAVFLGLHLLVTDPATSPRTTFGKVIFGGLYGALAFALFGLFEALGVPTFYDKLLPVPILNLSVRRLDAWSRALAARIAWLEPANLIPAVRLNRATVAIWVALFVAIFGTGFLGREHPGRDPEFWKKACEQGRVRGCKTWVSFLELGCKRDAATCAVLGGALRDGRGGARDVVGAGKSFAHACDAAVPGACDSLQALAQSDGPGPFQADCDSGDSDSCFIAAELYANGFGTARDPERGFRMFQKLCDDGWARGCGRLADDYLSGEGTGRDSEKAIAGLARACGLGHAPSCIEAAKFYRRGIGGANEDAALASLSRACKLGLRVACRPGEEPDAKRIAGNEDAIAVQRLGG